MKDLIKRILDRERRLIHNYQLAILHSEDIPSKSRTIQIYLRLRLLIERFLVCHTHFWISDGLFTTMFLALKKGDVFVDAGANWGQYTWHAAFLVGPHGKVHSIEPSPTIIKLLRKWVACMGQKNVVITEAALGSRMGKETLYEFAENYGGASSIRGGAWPGHQHDTQTEVTLITLDDYVERNQIGPIRLINVDAQGSEIDILHGATRVLTQTTPPVLFVELERDANVAFGHTLNDLLAVIHNFGYMTFSWRPNGLIQINSQKNVTADTGHDDVICLNPNFHNHLITKLQKLADHRRSFLTHLIGRDIYS